MTSDAMRRHSSAVARATSIAAGCFFHWSRPVSPIWLARSMVHFDSCVSVSPRRLPFTMACVLLDSTSQT